MTKYVKRLALALGSSLLAVGLSFLASTPTPAATSGAPVNIAGVTVPSVPVSGTVNVGNTPSVNVASLPSVSIGGNINASVSNPAGNGGLVPLVIEDSENSVRTAFSVEGACFPNKSGFCDIAPLFSVPAGQVAVIEFASGSCEYPQGISFSFADVFFDASGGNTSPYRIEFVPGPATPNGDGFFTNFAQNLRTYALGGTNGNAINFKAGFAGSGTLSSPCLVGISGHLIMQ